MIELKFHQSAENFPTFLPPHQSVNSNVQITLSQNKDHSLSISANSSTTYSSTLPPTTAITTYHDQPLSLISINIVAQVQFKLAKTNYLSWKIQFYVLLTGRSQGYVDGIYLCPPITITVDSQTYANLAFSHLIR